MRKLLLLLLVTTSAHATCSGSGTVWSCTTSGGITSAQVQTAVNSASDTVTVTFANGTYPISNISLNNRNGISLVCATIGGCLINGASVNIFTNDNCTATKTNLMRVSGFKFTGDPSTAFIWLYCVGFDIQQVRIDNNDFQLNAAAEIAVLIGDSSPQGNRVFGVMDHNNCHSPTVNFLCMKDISGTTAWFTGTRGTINNFFFESNTCNFGAMPNNGAGCVDEWQGHGAVIRFNTMFNGRMVNHSYCHNGPYNSEVYGNTINTPGDSPPQFRNIHFQGSGEEIGFGNTVEIDTSANNSTITIQHFRGDPSTATSEGSCNSLCDGTVTGSGNDPTTANDGNRSGQLGYPCWHQPGRNASAVLSPVYIFMNKNAAGTTKADAVLGSGGNAPSQVVANRDYYNAVSINAQSSPTSPFNGTSGVGFGTLANRPATCTPTTQALDAGHGGVGYWATDQGNWNQSGNGFGQGVLYTCTSTNTWTLVYTPFTFPHPLVGGGPPTVATPTFSPSAGSYLSSQIITISTATGGATICYTNDGTTPAANGAGTCTHGTTLSNGGTVTVSFTTLLQAVGTQSGFTDSGVGSAQYTFPTASTPTSMARLVRAMVLSLL